MRFPIRLPNFILLIHLAVGSLTAQAQDPGPAAMAPRLLSHDRALAETSRQALKEALRDMDSWEATPLTIVLLKGCILQSYEQYAAAEELFVKSLAVFPEETLLIVALDQLYARAGVRAKPEK